MGKHVIYIKLRNYQAGAALKVWGLIYYLITKYWQDIGGFIRSKTQIFPIKHNVSFTRLYLRIGEEQLFENRRRTMKSNLVA